MDFHARQYDPQLGRFLGVDPLADAGGQETLSPYAAMGNAPESVIDPNGEFATSPSVLQKDYGTAIDASGDISEELLGMLNDPVGGTGSVGGGSDHSLGTGGRADGKGGWEYGHDFVAIKQMSEPAKKFWWAITLGSLRVGNTAGNLDNKRNRPIPQMMVSLNDEEPVKFYGGNDPNLDKVLENHSYNEGDNIFYVMGHGFRQGMVDDNAPNQVVIWDAVQFDKQMSLKSPAYKAAIENNKPFTLYLYACFSANMAKKISAAHPNALVIGPNGAVHWGIRNGVPTMLGIETWKGTLTSVDNS